MTATAPETENQHQNTGAPKEAPPISPELVDAGFRVPLLALFIGGAAWLVLGSIFGLIASIKFHSPVFLADSAWLTYGRVRPAATLALVYGFCIPAGIGVATWLLARLGRSRLVAAPAYTFGAVLWNLGVLVGLSGILSGDATGFELMEIPGYAAGILFAAYLLLGVPALLTLQRRTQKTLYVSQWFLLAALFWFPWIFSTAALLLPGSFLRGMAQAVVAWWFASNLQFVWCGLVGLGILLYFIPKLTNRDLCSHNKALFVFWVLILFGSWCGIPSSAPVPAWIPTLSASMTWITILLPVTVALVFYSTVDGKLSQLWSVPGMKFFGFALVAFLAAAVMNVANALPAVGRVTAFTWFVAAEDLMQLYGFFAMALFGAAYLVIPQVTGVEWPFPRLARGHFWLAAAGTLLITLPWIVGGIVQGSRLQNPDVPFVDIARGSLMPLRLSTVGDLLLLMGHLLLLINIAALILGLTRARYKALATHFGTPIEPSEVKP